MRAMVLTKHEGRRIAINVARLPTAGAGGLKAPAAAMTDPRGSVRRSPSRHVPRPPRNRRNRP
jgi:hypothetical protein